MSWRPTVLGVILLCFGVYFACLEVVGTWEFFIKDQGDVNYIVLTACGIAAVSPLLPALADWFKREGKLGWKLAAWAMFFLCLTVVLAAAISRTGGAVDAAQQVRSKAERARAIAEAAERGAAADLELDRAAVLSECANGRGKKCEKAEAQRAATQKRLDAAREQFREAPPEQVDPTARRIAAVFHIPEDQVRLYQPLFVPMLASLLSAALIMAWAKMDFAHRAAIEPARPQELPEPPRVQAERRAIPAPRKSQEINADPIVAFLKARTKREQGPRVDWADIYRGYLEWHGQHEEGDAPEPKQFGAALAYICEHAKIATDRIGGKVYCLDMRLT